MRIALIGYGAMGQLVEKCAQRDGHEITVTLSSRDAALTPGETAERLRGSEVAIDFSVSEAVVANVTACAQAGVPLVEGTTGWNSQLGEVKRIVEQSQGALVYGANFSIGMQIFYRMIAYSAGMFARIEDYDAFIEEAHHSRKRDAPSGTALRMAAILKEQLSREIPIASTRAGYMPGTHRIGFDSIADQVLIAHTARSREGFAQGALLAAKWITGKLGVYDFSEAINGILGVEAKQQ